MRAAAVRAAAMLLALAACAAPAAAIYEEQAGQYDWLQQFVGKVALAQLTAHPRDRLYVTSAAGALAALSPQDGALLWRKVLAEGDAFTHLLALGTRVVTLSGNGTQLLGWDVDTGGAAWAAAVASSAEAQSGIDVAAVGTKAVAVAVGGAVKAFGVTDGRALWSASLAGSRSRLFAAADGGVWAASLAGSQLSLAHLNAQGEASQQSSVATGDVQLDAAQLVAGEAGVAALSADGGSLCAAECSAPALACRALASLLPAGTDAAGARLVPGACGGHVTLQVAGGAAVLALGGSAGASVAAFAPGAAASGCYAGGASAPLATVASPSADGLRLRVLSAADGSAAEAEVAVPALAPRRMGGEPVGVAALFSGAGGARHLAVLDDDSLALVAGGGLAWLRHEELASVVDVLFADLPAPTPENEAAWLRTQPGLADALRAQAASLKAQAGQLANLALASPEERALVARHKALTSDKLRPTRDADGFRKQLLLLTAGGKLLALHNGDGRLLWSLDWGRAAAPTRLALWRVPHDAQHDLEVAAFRVGGGATTATVINAHTGAVVRTLAAPFEAADLLPLPAAAHDGTADQRVFVAVPPGQGGAAALLPDTPGAAAAFAAARPGLTFWRADTEAGTITGLGFTGAGEVEERWAAAVAPAPARLLAVQAHVAGEAVYSPARVLGSGELKFRYLNPNTLLAAAGSPGPRPSLTVRLLDAVTGRVLYAQTHQGASGPVHAVLSENVAAYHFWSVEAHRWQMASVELYDASPPALRVADLAFGETNGTSSSWDVPPLEAGSQTFLCRMPVAGLSVTRSARGNTAKQVIMLGAAGGVCLLDRRFLDPRRPIVPPGQKPTPEQAAEALPPYAPELPLAGPMFATLNNEVARLSGVAVEAAELESTMLMLAHGLDLFYTRLTPSRSFDMVPDDFPYALLVLILASLSGATLVLSFLQGRGTLKLKWQ